MWKKALVVLVLVVHFFVQVRPAWEGVVSDRSGRDFASYYYAWQAARDGESPYDTDVLSALAAADKTRPRVHPFFYPPPFLLTMAWVEPLSLKVAYRAMFVLNELLLLGSLWWMWRRFRVPAPAIALLLCTFTPIPDNLRMGQANLFALFPTVLGLALAPTLPWVGGALVGLAGMLKMSPALFLGYWALRRQWRPILAAMATAVGLSLLVLPLVPFSAQWAFYTEILPGFSKGDYHGLTVPISLEANHSVPDLYDRLFPTRSRFLSEPAQTASSLTLAGLLALWAWLFRKPGNEAAAVGALTVLMVVAPVYTYEHHLVFLLLAVGAAAGLSPAFFFVYPLLAWPLQHLRAVQAQAPEELKPWVRESKTIAEAGLFLLLAARRGKRAG